MSTDNPLLRAADLPPFADIRPEHVQPAIDALLADAEAALERAVGPEVAADYDALALLRPSMMASAMPRAYSATALDESSLPGIT